MFVIHYVRPLFLWDRESDLLCTVMICPIKYSYATKTQLERDSPLKDDIREWSGNTDLNILAEFKLEYRIITRIQWNH